MPEAVHAAVFWAAMVLFAAHAGLALAAAGIPCVTSLTGLRKVKHLKIFIDKFGQQAATFALLGGLWSFIVLLASLAAVRFLLPEASAHLLALPLPICAILGPVLLGGFAFLSYRGMWQRLKTRKGLHAVFGLSATILLWAGLYGGLAAMRTLVLRLPPAGMNPGFLLPPGNSLLWRLLAEGLALSLGLAGTFTAGWLVWRRDKDDFGRDYYNFTMRLSARVGFAGQVAALAGMGWLIVGLLPIVGELSGRLSAALALYGTGTLATLACLGMTMIRENVLRHKFFLALAFFTSLAALTGLCAGLASLLVPGLSYTTLP